MSVGRARLANQFTESAESAATPAAATSLEITALLLDRLPLNERELGTLLVSDGLALEPIPLGNVARLYRSRGQKVPFRIIRCAGAQIAVAPDAARTATAVGAAAVRMVQHWGLGSVEALAERVEALTATSVPVSTIRRLLRALPDTRWLDGAQMGWFSLCDRPDSGLTSAVDKIFSVAPAVDLTELRHALAKCLPAIADAPLSVLESYLVQLAGCTIDDGGWVRRTVVARAAALVGPEATLARLLAESGGEVDPGALRRSGADASLSDTTITRLLRFSPLFLRTPTGRIRLVGGGEASAPSAA